MPSIIKTGTPGIVTPAAAGAQGVGPFGGGAGGAAGYTTTATNYNGSTQRVERTSAWNPAPLSSGDFFVSFWLKFDTLPSPGLREFFDSDTLFLKIRARRLEIELRNNSGTIIYEGDSPVLYAVDGNWVHTAFSYKSSGSGPLYIDGVRQDPINVSKNTFQSLGWTGAGATSFMGRTNGDRQIDGCLSELILHNEYLDLFQQSNRDKLRDPVTGKPVDVGADGSLVFGTAPIVYMKDGITNTGTGGAYTGVNSPTACASSPTD